MSSGKRVHFLGQSLCQAKGERVHFFKQNLCQANDTCERVHFFSDKAYVKQMIHVLR